MEASVIFVLARVWGLRSGGIAVILDNMLEVSRESGIFDPEARSNTVLTTSIGYVGSPTRRYGSSWRPTRARNTGKIIPPNRTWAAEDRICLLGSGPWIVRHAWVREGLGSSSGR
jgi:hypothetical protein